MKKQSFPFILPLCLVVLGLSVLLTGCARHTNEAPTAGYPGGQKAGAVNNAASSSGGPSNGMYRQPGAANNGPSSAGAMSPGR